MIKLSLVLTELIQLITQSACS